MIAVKDLLRRRVGASARTHEHLIPAGQLAAHDEVHHLVIVHLVIGPPGLDASAILDVFLIAAFVVERILFLECFPAEGARRIALHAEGVRIP